MSGSYPNLKVNISDIDNFALFSHDRNPLHTDDIFARKTFFGRRISHGALAVLKVLVEHLATNPEEIQALDVEFRRPVFPDIDYTLSGQKIPDGLKLTVADDTAEVMIITLRYAGGNQGLEHLSGGADTAWVKKVNPDKNKADDIHPSNRQIKDFKTGDLLFGHYSPDFSQLASEWKTVLPSGVFTLIGLASYIVGMKSPGLRSLFTRLSIEFNTASKAVEKVMYKLETKGFDPKFRMLKNELTVCDNQGNEIAAGELRSYVRFTPVETDYNAVQKTMAGARPVFKEKVALVCGASKGLGVDIAMCLAFSGCKVYATYVNSRDAVDALTGDVVEYGLDIEFVRADAGDEAWCEQMCRTIDRQHGGLDILVLNAATPPKVFEFGKNDVHEFDAYISNNIKLVQRPLNAFMRSVNRKQGIISAVSSSFVVETPKEFPQYVALKQAVEGMIQSLGKEYPDIRFVLPRPPKLQTSWNDTPTGALGAIPAIQVAAGMVLQMASSRHRGVVILSEFKPISVSEEKPENLPADYHVVIASNFTADLIAPGFAVWFKELNIKGEVVFSPYNQILQELINPNSQLSSNKDGVSVVLLKVKDWLRELDESKIQSEDRVREFLEKSVQEFTQAMKTHRGHCKVETTLVICPGEELDKGPSWSGVLEHIEQQLILSLDGLPGVTILKAEDFNDIYQIKEDQIHDSLREKIGHIPYHKSYFYFLATLVMRNVYRKMVPICKVVVVDCDNTLWKGVVGEVGADGLVFEKSHIALQEKLMGLSRGGVVISLCSKNEEFDVWRVFDNREDFKLNRGNIVSAMINWQPKSENIKKLASQLNLGLANFVFIDDNPVECAEVQAACPEVLTIQWPQDPEKAYTLLNHIWEMDIKKGTAVDQKRTQMYKEELKRQEFMEDKVDFGAFIKSLELKTDLRDLNDEDLPRASQLTMRTNQFNFTTRRRKEGELKAIMHDDNFIMQTVRVSDRFGDYGLVGFYIGEIRSGELVVDTFLLSCRVLGRGVEHYMLNELGRFAGKNSIDTVRLEVFPTPRNTPARDFLKSASPAGCCKIDEDGGILSIIPSKDLMEIELVHSADKEPEEEEIQETKERSPDADENIRSRETRIKRAAYELSDMGALSVLIDGEKAQEKTGAEKGAGNLDKEALAEVVYGVFSRELKLPVDVVKEGDLLEDLGCDSFKIVEITVLLKEKFSWLPVTLLFEHRGISDIIEAIYQAGQGETGQGVEPGLQEARASEGLSHDIAVIGIGVACSGGQSKEALWDLLSSGETAIQKVSPDRPFFLEPFKGDQDHWAGLMDDIDGFDAEFFNVSPREAVLTDPQTRLVLETSWKALEDAGYTGVGFTEDTGVYIGAMYSDYSIRANQVANEEKSLYRSWETFSIANRLSHFMGFRGPSFTVNTACSSSGTAIHLACSALRAGECRMAVAGGVNLILDPNRFAQLKRLGILSPTGKCRPFCDDSNGVLLGEGAGILVMKPLAEAVKDRDHVYGVIKGSALSSGTGSIGFTAPNPTAQALAISKCIRDAGVDPRTISYLETHGTGTSLGDPIEVRGATLAYGNKGLWDNNLEGEQKCSIGSIKPNVGHLESGAAVLSLIKVLLQFEKRALLPSITSGKLNSKIPFEDTPFNVQRSLSKWERPVYSVGGQDEEYPRRAGVNSFGVGGANVHLILEEPGEINQKREQEPLALQDRNSLYAFPLSADSRPSLMNLLKETAVYLKSGQPGRMSDICHTASMKRRHFSNRVVFIASEIEALSKNIERFVNGETPAGCFVEDSAGVKNKGKTAFLFTGQGSQYVTMGRGLYDTHSVFKDALDECAAILEEWIDYSLMDIINPQEENGDTALVDKTQYTQIALFSIEYALSQLWMSWGIRPDYAAGHSAGEIIALTVSGVLSLADGLKLIHARGKLMQALPAGGKMVAIRMSASSAEELIKDLSDQISIASVNGPEQVVLSGAGEVVEKIVSGLEKDGIDFKYLNVSHAFHSPLIEPMLEEYLDVIDKLVLGQPRFPVVSCVDGQVIDTNKIDSDYWGAQVRQAVLFLNAMETLDSKGVSRFIEIGPHPVLLGMGSLCLPHYNMAWLPSLRKNKADCQTIYESLARLYAMGMDLNWSGICGSEDVNKAELPAYHFHHGRYWLKNKFQSVVTQIGKKDLSNCLYGLDWIEAPYGLDMSSDDRAQTWIVFSDQTGMGDALTKQLEQKGHSAVQVFSGKKYSETLKRNASIDGIAFLWGMEGCGRSDITVSDIRDYEEQVLNTFLGLAREVKALDNVSKPKLWVVTRLTQMPAVQSMMWGFGRGLALEYPEIWGGLIELSPEFKMDSGMDDLVNVLVCPDGEDQVRLGINRRWIPRLTPKSVVSGAKVGFAENGVYMVTGGLGVLGQRLILWMVSCGVQRIIVTSRKGMDSTGAGAFAESVRKAGAKIDVVALDIGKQDDVSNFFNTLLSDQVQLKGIFHLAGIDQLRSVDNLKMEDIRHVLEPKVEGTWMLHQHSLDFDLDLFVCFSSISSILGSENRAHYSAANAFIDSIVAYRRENNLPGINVNWGPWDKGGMASREDIASYAKIGNYALDPNAAIKIFEELLGTDSNAVVVADIDWTVFSKIYEARRPRPMISLCKPVSESDEFKEIKEKPAWVELLLGKDSQERKHILIKLLTDEISHLLGYEKGCDLEAEDDFTNTGVDSLIAAELAVSIQKNFGLKDMVIVYDYPNITALANKLLGDLADSISGEDPVEAGESEEQIVGYNTDLESRILEFFYKAWPNRNRDLIEPRWRWMYLDSARRLDIEPMMWNYMEVGNVIGYTGAIPVQAKLGKKFIRTAWCVDTMVLKSCRDKGLGPLIMMKARENLPFNLSLGQTKEMRSILFRLGWQQVAALQVYVYPLRPGKMLKGKMNPLLAETAGAGLHLLAYTKSIKARSKLYEVEVRELDQFNERHDKLWKEVSHDYECAVVRDASYLNWKYADQPGQAFKRFEMKRGNKVVATAVLMFREPGPHTPYKYRRAYIIDLVTSISDQKLVLSVLDIIRKETAKLKFDSIVFEIISKDIESALEHFGFIKRDPTRFFLVHPGDMDENEAKKVLRADNWFITKGDSDIDRPEGTAE